jgi:hypothetical protein
MKKIYFLAVTLLAGISSLDAQSVVVRNTADGSTIANNSVFYEGTTAGNISELDFEFKNTSASNKNYNVRRYDLAVNKVSATDSAEAYYCTGLNCYPPTTTITPSPVAVNANSTVALKLYLTEASVVGQTSIKYEVYDVANPTDMVTFTVKYNSPLSVKTTENVFSLSDVYPNPVNTKAFIGLNSVAAISGGSISITNSLGSVVSLKGLDIAQGKNTIPLETENLSSGIYFVTITAKNQRIIKKFYIN